MCRNRHRRTARAAIHAPIFRHPREGGDPASLHLRRQKTLGSRLRGNDGDRGRRESAAKRKTPARGRRFGATQSARLSA
ncbi:hypothetical protein FQY83_05985 [Luteimonas marina]|uniref:Uncharacterized protein n=1 Tax=Luteimonas marina TaxID=488485 RepID=A0A5C5UAJ3_9GAMM|nr:hypothetical protein FQY83_05985 [Luteimonas marina]